MDWYLGPTLQVASQHTTKSWFTQSNKSKFYTAGSAVVVKSKTVNRATPRVCDWSGEPRRACTCDACTALRGRAAILASFTKQTVGFGESVAIECDSGLLRSSRS